MGKILQKIDNEKKNNNTNNNNVQSIYLKH
jgi:hypothetical protein